MMEEPDDVLLHRRRRFFVVNSLIAAGFSAVGLVMGLLDGIWFGYFITAFFGAAAIGWVCRLLIPAEALLTMREDHFRWFPPDFASASPPLSAMQPAAKLAPPPSERTISCGVWDRELDGSNRSGRHAVAKLIVTRPRLGCLWDIEKRLEVLIDGNPKAQIGLGEALVMDLPPGPHQVSARLASAGSQPVLVETASGEAHRLAVGTNVGLSRFTTWSLILGVLPFVGLAVWIFIDMASHLPIAKRGTVPSHGAWRMALDGSGRALDVQLAAGRPGSLTKSRVCPHQGSRSGFDSRADRDASA